MSILQRFLETDIEFAKELVRSFITNLHALRISIVQAVEQQDGQIYTKAHHQAKATLGYIDQEKLKQYAEDINKRIKEHGIQAINKQMQQTFSQQCILAIDELNNRLANHRIVL
jgi:HPt (histidine-containing phosphotransfer) domain-containing protein